jgi:hypothetical protein
VNSLLGLGELRLVLAQSGDSCITLALDLSQDLIEPRVIGCEEEGPLKIDAGLACASAQPTDDVADVRGEESGQVLGLTEVGGDLIQRATASRVAGICLCTSPNPALKLLRDYPSLRRFLVVFADKLVGPRIKRSDTNNPLRVASNHLFDLERRGIEFLR